MLRFFQHRMTHRATTKTAKAISIGGGVLASVDVGTVRPQLPEQSQRVHQSQRPLV